MIVFAAGAFLTFVGFLFGGLLALVVTAALDRTLGKEKALLLWSGVLLLFTLWQCTPDPVAVRARVRPERDVPAARLDVEAGPLAGLEAVEVPAGRNPYQKQTDTRRLPPIELEVPPWLDLPFALPPTVPGPAPTSRGDLHGEMPSLSIGDGTTIPAIPDPVFSVYEVKAEDVYDWGMRGSRQTMIYIRSIRHDGVEHEEGTPGYETRKWWLQEQEGPWDELVVEYAIIPDAGEKTAPEAVVEWRRKNVTTGPAEGGPFESWHLRRTVDNLFVEALRRTGVGDVEREEDVGQLLAAAQAMAAVGRTGKEDKEGWRRAALLRERALAVAREREGPARRAEILELLVEAYRALRDEDAVLAVLAEYARTSPTRPEPWLRLGEVHLDALLLPTQALEYFDAALERDPRRAEGHLGRGDALSALGRHEEALRAYEQVTLGHPARVRQAEAHLRLGAAQRAVTAAQSALREQPGAPRALLALGGARYLLGELAEAREACLEAAQATGDEALRYRAQATYDLGLVCWRMGQADAARAAFEACARALRFGAEPGRFPDETVSPELGMALVALAAGNESSYRESLQAARETAPRVAYHELLAGMVASREDNLAAAVRALERALVLDPLYGDVDGWMALTRQRIAEGALRTGTPLAEATPIFEAAIAFAERASTRARLADRGAFRPHLREAWIRLGAAHLPARQRFEAARAVVDGILARVDNEQPAALAIRGYCNYRLGDVDQCIRDFQLVLDAVPAEDAGPWAPWRAYAARAQEAVKHWDSLEELIVRFEGTTLPDGWSSSEGAGVRVRIDPEAGVVVFEGSASRDGAFDEPTVALESETLFDVGAFEEVRLRLRIPTRDRRGEATNNVTFGVQVQRAASRSGSARHPGIGIFYDKGKLAARVGTGQLDAFRDGELHRLVPETAWPADGFVGVRIARGEEPGAVEVYLDPDPDDGLEPEEPVFEDVLSGFREGTRGRAELWIGGYAGQAQPFDIQLEDIRIIRRTK